MEGKFYSSGNGFTIEYKEQATNQMPDKHYHKYYELYCLLSGKRTLLIDDKTIDLQQGSIIVISPDVFHKFTDNESRSAYSALIINFSQDVLPKHLVSNQKFIDLVDNQYQHVAEPDIKSFSDAVNTIKREISAKKPLYEFILYSSFIELLTNVLRAERTLTTNPKDALEHEDMISLVSMYITKNLEGDLSLETLASKFFVSTSYLSRKFKKETSVNLSKFINEKRIQKAIWMMQTQKFKNLQVVAKRCGFTSISNFNRCFKEIMHCSPSAFYKNVKRYDE